MSEEPSGEWWWLFGDESPWGTDEELEEELERERLVELGLTDEVELKLTEEQEKALWRHQYEKWAAKGRQIDGIAAVLTGFFERRDPRVRPSLVAYALGWVGDASCVPLLIDALEDPYDSYLRVEAAVALKRLGDGRAVNALCRAARNDCDQNVRANAVGALGAIGGPRARACIKWVLKNDDDRWVREMAQATLNELESAKPSLGAPGPE